jgi:hypothetical protein
MMRYPAGVEGLSRAILYEGYLLYPYGRRSLKNTRRWNFGVLVPRSYSDAQKGSEAWLQQTQCLVRGGRGARLRVATRFLQLAPREDSSGAPEGRADAAGNGRLDDIIEREVVLEAALEELAARPLACRFAFPAGGEPDGLEGVLEGQVANAGAARRLTLQMRNATSFPAAQTAGREEALSRSMLGAHTILAIEGGEFVSLLDPPAEVEAAAAACRNLGTWPVLAGTEGERTLMISSPIILYDYPRIAPESAGDFFDLTEIDELLTLHLAAMGEHEKSELCRDERTRALLERAEALLGEAALRLHGAERLPVIQLPRVAEQAGEVRADASPVLERGARVRLHPRQGADAMDLFLADKTAVVESVDRDVDGRVHVSVTLESDPGRDLGARGKPGHRFFFRLEEVEVISGGTRGRRS